MEGPCADEDNKPKTKNLELLLKNMEHDFIKKRHEETLHRILSASKNYPGKLMSSQSVESAWRVRTNDLAVEEILRERRAAIESGKLKGRRLFKDEEDEAKVGFTSSGLEFGLVEESEVRSVFSYESDDDEDENWLPRKEHLSGSYPRCSYSSSSSSLCAAEALQRGSGSEKATTSERKTACDTVGRGRARLNVLKVSVAISLIFFIVVIIISNGSFGAYEDEEVILTPT